MKRKPGLGETVKVKKKAAMGLWIHQSRIGTVVDTNAPLSGYCPYDVLIELTAPNGVKFDIPMRLKELKRA